MTEIRNNWINPELLEEIESVPYHEQFIHMYEGALSRGQEQLQLVHVAQWLGYFCNRISLQLWSQLFSFVSSGCIYKQQQCSKFFNSFIVHTFLQSIRLEVLFREGSRILYKIDKEGIEKVESDIGERKKSYNIMARTQIVSMHHQRHLCLPYKQSCHLQTFQSLG